MIPGLHAGSIPAGRLLSGHESGRLSPAHIFIRISGSDPNLTHFYPHRPVAFSKIFSIFIRILPQGVQCTFRGPRMTQSAPDKRTPENWDAVL